MVSNGVLEREKGHLSQPWERGEIQEGFLEEVMPYHIPEDRRELVR